MQEIAQEAGINQALLHYYFRTKDRLYEMVYRQIFDQFFQPLMPILEADLPFDRFLQQFIEIYLESLRKNPDIVHFIFWELRRGGKVAARQIRRRFRSLGPDNPLLKRIHRAVEAGEIRRVDPLHFILSILGMCIYPFLARPIISRVFSELDVLSDEFLARRKKEIFQLIWEGIAPGNENMEEK